ncbi:MAG: 30S ribosomal protein S19 [Caldisphaera sp.]|jgi:small subunit ribosomal protein S19|nr:30S ribosomal protein S19 [Caldisphaera sp.]PMP59394.1 MAG: 30S ribosomal protein S19 [Caldisphaera sp.]
MSIELRPEWKRFKYRGKSLEEIFNMPMDELANLFPSRSRRSLNRGFTSSQKILLSKIRALRKEMQQDPSKVNVVIKTHVRDLVILPEMLGLTIAVHNGKEFVPIKITPEMLGHRLGDFSHTTRAVRHGEPGLKASKSSLHVAAKV